MRTKKTLAMLGAASLAALVLNTPANAELLGFPNGRSADPEDRAKLSVEAGVVQGEYVNADYQNIGLRVNYAALSFISVFADYAVESEYETGFTDITPFDGDAFGAGLFFYVPNQTTVPSLDVAAKLSYHQADLTADRPGAQPSDQEQSVVALELLVSGKTPIPGIGAKWYANLGINRIDTEFVNFIVPDSTETELGLGAGLVLSPGPVDIYLGVDQVESLTYGVGVRYNAF